MLELISLVCVIGLFVLVGLVAWGITELIDFIHSKRWEGAKAKDAHLRMLIENRKSAWKQYKEAHDAFYKVKSKIDELLDPYTHKYLSKSDVEVLVEEAEKLKPEYHRLYKVKGDKHGVYERINKEFDDYCKKNGYLPWIE